MKLSSQLLMTNSSGSIELWSTQAEVRNPNGYCLFKIGRKTEHIGVILALELNKGDRTRAMTGASDGCLKIWDMGAGDIMSFNTFRNAHADSITGISSSHDSPLFATCSRDKSFCIWDERLTRPIVGFNEGHNYAYTVCYWSDVDECKGHILLGDEAGNIHSVDMRNIKEFTSSINVHKTPIHRIKLRKNLVTVLGQSNVIQVLNAIKDFEQCYRHSDSKDFVRDVCWTTDNSFCSTAWDDKQLKTHVVLL